MKVTARYNLGDGDTKILYILINRLNLFHFINTCRIFTNKTPIDNVNPSTDIFVVFVEAAITVGLFSTIFMLLASSLVRMSYGI